MRGLRVLVLLVVLLSACMMVARTAWKTDRGERFTMSRAPMNPRYAKLDVSGYAAIGEVMEPWRADDTLREIAPHWEGVGRRGVAKMDAQLAKNGLPKNDVVRIRLAKAALQLYDGEAAPAYETLSQLRSIVESDPRLCRVTLSSVIFMQAVSGIRLGENSNCVACRGESSCIVPISAAAVHRDPAGSRLAVKHFKEYLELFPDDIGVQWLLEVAYMTLGEDPGQHQPEFHRAVERFFRSEFDIGRFRDISHETGLHRVNQAGGAIMDDFDGDGRLDIVVTATDPTEPMAFYHNRGDGSFDDRTRAAGIEDQLGGLVCYQADYDNDGRLDIFVPRGAWYDWPIRPSLLRNAGSGRFTDVTAASGLLDPVNSNGAAWADYDNDGWVDLFVACEIQNNRLYHNKGDGTFEELARSAGVEGDVSRFAKGCTWIDYDNDGYPDLFLTHFDDTGRLYHNQRDGHFVEVTTEMGIDGPEKGVACWAWDYDNDGWLDIFATSQDRELSSIVKTMIGEPPDRSVGRLFRNDHGAAFRNVTVKAGLDGVYAPMGANFADFDNDGWLDFYLGTGEPSLATLVPNRMFKNVQGSRFADITGSSRTGHLQKGHGVACGDWDRDGDIDLFVETGGAVNGDKYHNVFFQNPGQGNHSLTIRLKGRKTNRAAIGARIKVVTEAAGGPRSIYRHVSSGSSFGANPLQQTIGLADARKVSTLQVEWPTSHTTQVFHDVKADQSIEITEFDRDYRPLDWKPLPQPK